MKEVCGRYAYVVVVKRKSVRDKNALNEGWIEFVSEDGVVFIKNIKILENNPTERNPYFDLMQPEYLREPVAFEVLDDMGRKIQNTREHYFRD